MCPRTQNMFSRVPCAARRVIRSTRNGLRIAARFAAHHSASRGAQPLGASPVRWVGSTALHAVWCMQAMWAAGLVEERWWGDESAPRAALALTWRSEQGEHWAWFKPRCDAIMTAHGLLCQAPCIVALACDRDQDGRHSAFAVPCRHGAFAVLKSLARLPLSILFCRREGLCSLCLRKHGCEGSVESHHANVRRFSALVFGAPARLVGLLSS